MKVIFHGNQLCYRGTSNALFDYATYNQQLLGNESIILYDKNNPNNFPPAIEHFKKHFEVYSYKEFREINNIIKQSQSDVLYVLNSGKKSNIISYDIKTVIHAVFKYYEPYGDVYAYVSEWLSKEMTGGQAPYVPHMITLPSINTDLRQQLGIPKNAIVFGRHGGLNTFDIKFAKETVKEISKKRKDIYFLFLGTEPFTKKTLFNSYNNIIYLPITTDPIYKTEFINTCDAYLHARTQGESFGIAIGEFSIKNKPIITWDGSEERSHLDILGNNAIKYSNKKDLYSILNDFKINNSKNWDSYSRDFNVKSIMQKFKNVFLE